MEQGWCRRDAEHLATIELTLDVAANLPDEAFRVLVKHVETAIAWTPVFFGALYCYAVAEHALTWRRMSRLVADDAIRQRFGVLATHSEGFLTMTVDSEETLAELLTPEDLTSLDAALLAEARGDFALALELLQTVPMPTDDGWVDSLRQIAESDLDDDPVLWGRYFCHAALRSTLQLSQNRQTLSHFGALALLAVDASADTIRNESLNTALRHPLIHDVLIFEAGGLRNYLDHDLAEGVAARSPGVQSWPETAPSVLRIEANLGAGFIRCMDVATRELLTLQVGGLADNEPVGCCLFGRVVRVDGDDTNYLATRPFGLDPMTATRVAGVIKRGGSVDDQLTELLRGTASPDLVVHEGGAPDSRLAGRVERGSSTTADG